MAFSIKDVKYSLPSSNCTIKISFSFFIEVIFASNLKLQPKDTNSLYNLSPIFFASKEYSFVKNALSIVYELKNFSFGISSHSKFKLSQNFLNCSPFAQL